MSRSPLTYISLVKSLASALIAVFALQRTVSKGVAVRELEIEGSLNFDILA